MAEAHSVDDLTHCPICFEKYDRPRYLPCLHTFCEKCLQTYIDTTVGNDSKTEGFNCPTCRRLIEVPASEDVQWGNLAETFPLNHLIVTLMDITLSAETLKFCGPCRKRSIEVPPMSWCKDCKEFLCGQCVEYHKTLPILEGHLIETLKDINEVDVISTPTFHCEKHPDKKLEMFCEDHDIPCCMSCTMTEHRKCERVETLENVVKRRNLVSMREDIAEQFSNVLENLNESIATKRDSYKRFNEQCDEMKSKVQETTAQITTHVKTLCSDALEELSTIKDKQELISLSDIGYLKERKNVIERYRRLLSVKTEEMPAIHSFMEMRRLTECLAVFKEMKTATTTGAGFNHEVDGRIFKMLDVKTLLAQKEQENTDSRNESDTENSTSIEKVTYKTITYRSTLNFETRKKNTFISNCVFLEKGGLLIVDYKVRESHDGILRLNDSDMTNFKTIRISGKPWAAAELSEHFIAVTIPSNETICFLITLTLEPIYQQCDRKFFGITVKEGLPIMYPDGVDKEYFEKCCFFVSSKGEVHLRSFSGKTLRTLNISSTYIQHISYCDGVIYFSAKDNLYFVKEDGGSIFEFSDLILQGTSGLTVGNNRDLAVCCRKSNMVVIIDENGKEKTKVQVDSPSCVAFSSDCNTLCVVQGGPSIDNRGFVYNIVYDK